VTPPCKICGAATTYAGELDANKCCLDRTGARLLPVSDVKIPYLVCTDCGLIFTNFMDQWTAEDFRRHIYNDDYARINPPVPGRMDVPVRETFSYQAGQRIAACFDGAQTRIRMLDFGAGGDPGPTGQALIDAGFALWSFDPYRGAGAEPDGRFEVIIAIEVLEHCHDFRFVADFMTRYLADDGVIWIQTVPHPRPAPEHILTSWYIAPRDGHISVHTLWSLTALFNRIGMNFVQTTLGMFAFRRLPSFPNRIFVET